MRVGSIGYTTYQGLGILLKDFYDNGIIDEVAKVHHHCRVNHHQWFKGPIIDRTKKNSDAITQFVETMDLMFFFETPFSWELVGYCKKIGVKTLLMPMYECTPTRPELSLIDKIFAPSRLDQQVFPGSKFTPVPIPRWVKWKERSRARVFVHNAGHLGLNGRNGTAELIKAIPHVKSPIKLILRSQDETLEKHRNQLDPRIDLRCGTFPQEELYDEGDVFIFPEAFNGLSLPLQEAKASGMLIMANDRFPINTWTQRESLIPVREYTSMKKCLAREVQAAVVNPIDIARMIDYWYDRDIRQHSRQGAHFAELLSWDRLKYCYQHEISSVVKS